MLAGRFGLVLVCALTACVRTPEQAALEATRDAEKAVADAQRAASAVAARNPATMQSDVRALPASPLQPASTHSVATTAPPTSSVDPSYSQRFKNNFFLGCLKEMSSGEDSLPPVLSGQVCACATSSLVASLDAKQLEQLDVNLPASFQLLVPHVEVCVETELPKYIKEHPDFMWEYAEKHPEVLPPELRK